MTPTPNIRNSAETIIRIAMPVSEGRLHEHFGGCREFAFIDADMSSSTVIATQTIAAPPHTPGAFPRWLREQGVQVVIASGIGRRALDNFAFHGIALHAGMANTPIHVLTAAYLAGLLKDVPASCDHHGQLHHHDTAGHTQ